MARSLWKGPFCEVAPDQRTIWSRRSMILPHFVGHTYHVHNGRTCVAVKVVPEMVGHRWGEFAATRRRAMHKVKTSRRSR